MGAADQPPITPDKARSAPSRSKPTSSHQRSGPKIKRLLNLGTKPGMAFPDTQDPRWKQLVAEWEQLDLDPHGLYIHFATAQQQRSNFESDLRRSRDESDPSIEILERALAHAEPLIRFLLKERDDDQEPVFADLAQSILTRVPQYLETLKRLDRERRLPAHRPGESWLPGHVRTLALHLHAKRKSWAQIEDWIYRFLCLAGHADVVTTSKIRHILRRVLSGQKPLPLENLCWRQRRAESDSLGVAVAGFSRPPRSRQKGRRRPRRLQGTPRSRTRGSAK